MKKKEEEMKTWMRKPKKALDIYRLTISTIFIFILAVLLVALYSIIMIKLKKQAHPSEQSANAEEQRARRNRNALKGAMSPNTHARANENKLEKDSPTFSSCVGDFGRLFLSV